MEDSKVSAVTLWLTPKDPTDIKSFLGLANFYRRFIRDFAKIATPLTHLLNKGVDFVWSDA
jgi:hypothetical protein